MVVNSWVMLSYMKLLSCADKICLTRHKQVWTTAQKESGGKSGEQLLDSSAKASVSIQLHGLTHSQPVEYWTQFLLSREECLLDAFHNLSLASFGGPQDKTLLVHQGPLPGIRLAPMTTKLMLHSLSLASSGQQKVTHSIFLLQQKEHYCLESSSVCFSITTILKCFHPVQNSCIKAFFIL